ncbi:hypothetical protein [Ornithinibacillus sp. JPR2-1]|uniref:hypothetical protein n=1 Tax=Ornithinibacillus sp. JPR2-1 TaxID=2094019 RepID=UPI0031E3C513
MNDTNLEQKLYHVQFLLKQDHLPAAERLELIEMVVNEYDYQSNNRTRIAEVEVVKHRKGVPSVLMVDGKRYVYDPQGK